MSVVIATLGRPDRLRAAIAALNNSDLPPHELVVVDGDAQGGAEVAVDELRAEVAFPIVYEIGPRGLTRQRNAGLRLVTGDIVVFLDDDASVAPDALRALLGAFGDADVVGATGYVDEPSSHRVGGQRSRLRRLLFSAGKEGTFTSFGYPRRIVRGDTELDVEFMPGCFMSARVDAARDLGFDERLEGYALAEDEDFSVRLARIGRIRYLPHARVRHDNTGFGQRDRRAFGRTVVVNRHYLFTKNFPQSRRARWQFRGFILVLLAHRAVNRDFAGALGLVDGARAVRRGERPGALA